MSERATTGVERARRRAPTNGGVKRRAPTRRLRALMALTFAGGFYTALLAAALAVGEGRFNAAVPNPWRELTLAPIAVALWLTWRAL